MVINKENAGIMVKNIRRPSIKIKKILKIFVQWKNPKQEKGGIQEKEKFMIKPSKYMKMFLNEEL